MAKKKPTKMEPDAAYLSGLAKRQVVLARRLAKATTKKKMRNKPPQFALGVDVEKVVRRVLLESREKSEGTDR
jgi:hypothetical protein